MKAPKGKPGSGAYLEPDPSLFANIERARRDLERIKGRVPNAVYKVISPLLAEEPDPDGALNLFERLTDQAGEELLQNLERHPVLIHYALTVFGQSQYLGEALLQNLDLFHTLLRATTLDRSCSREEFREAFARFRSRSFETDISQLLARFKRREYVRIMLRDVLGLATLAEVTAEISALSDVLIEEALTESETVLRNKFGLAQHKDPGNKLVPTPFAILALGKLGGNELNYSSDIDLVFLYGNGEAPDDAPLTNHEYFIRLAQQVTDVLSRVTKEGIVFRIDLRLRPQGREGESAVSLGRALEYYAKHANDWERQAMIKARHCAGDANLSRQFIRKVQDHVYTEDVNFAAIETALRTRDRIADRRKNALATSGGLDVKLDRGGIRDIEFLVQCLQRVHGGKEQWLRSAGTLFALQKLHDKQHIGGSEFHQLTTAYEFLRQVEHRLQLRHGQQLHRIPDDSPELNILARSLGQPADRVVQEIRSRMDAVTAIYERLIHHQQQQTAEQLTEDFQLRTLDLSFGRVQADHQILHRLAAEHSPLLDVARRTDLEPHTRRNLFRLLGSALTGYERYQSVAAVPDLVDRALEIFHQSEFLTDILVRHPDELAALSDLRQSASRHQGRLFSSENPIQSGQNDTLLDYLAQAGVALSEKLALLRRRYRHQMFLSGARDLLEARPVLSSFPDTTVAAEQAIAGAFAIAGRPTDFAVLALGRLGTFEFDCLSDADILFLRSDDIDSMRAMKSAEAIVEALSAYTSEGTVMPVDLRLRPHGNEGELTITPDQFAKYAASEAQPWEALSYTKLRFIAGDLQLAQDALASARHMRERHTTDPDFTHHVRAMRARIESSDPNPNFRTAPGGLYDIDFLVGYLTIKHGIHTADGNTRTRLQKLAQSGFLDGSQLQVLLDALELYRTTEHASRLVTGCTHRDLPVSEFARRSVEALVTRILGSRTEKLETQISETKIRVRALSDSVIF